MPEPPPIDDATVRASEGLLGGTIAADALARWAADSMVDESAKARSRQRWLAVQSGEEGTFAGTLHDLAERRRPVIIDVSGQRLRGVLTGIGDDFVVVRGDGNASAIVRTIHIELVRAEPGASMASGDRAEVVAADLAGILGPIAADRPDTVIRTRSGVLVRGRMQDCGRDLLRLRGDGDPPTPIWVPIDAISVLSLVG